MPEAYNILSIMEIKERKQASRTPAHNGFPYDIKNLFPIDPRKIRECFTTKPRWFFYLYFLVPILIAITALFLPNKTILIAVAIFLAFCLHILQQFKLFASNPRLRSNQATIQYLINNFLLFIISYLIHTTISNNTTKIILFVALCCCSIELIALVLKATSCYIVVLVTLFFALLFLLAVLIFSLLPALISLLFLSLEYFSDFTNSNLTTLFENWSSPDQVLLHFFNTSPQIKATIVTTTIAIAGGLSGIITNILRKPVVILDNNEESIKTFISETQEQFTIFIKSCSTSCSKKDLKNLLEYCSKHYPYVESHSSEEFSRTWQHLKWLLQRTFDTFPEDPYSKEIPPYLRILSLVLVLKEYFHMHWHKTEQYKNIFQEPITKKSILFITDTIGKDRLLLDMQLSTTSQKFVDPNLADIRKKFQKLNRESWGKYWEEFSFA